MEVRGGSGVANNYPNGTDCAWLFDFEEGQQVQVWVSSANRTLFSFFCSMDSITSFASKRGIIFYAKKSFQITFSRFSLESSDNCGKDYLRIRNGGFLSSPVLWLGCGSSRPTETFTSMGNRVFVEFHSDADTTST